MSKQPISSDQDIATMFRFFNEIGIIAQLSGAAFEKMMPGTMTLPQFTVLTHLTRLGGNRTPVEIARALQVSKGAMTNTISHLERAGWVTVRPDDRDGRSKRIDITEHGQTAHADTIAAIAPELAWLAGVISADLVEQAMPLLVEMRELLDRRRD